MHVKKRLKERASLEVEDLSTLLEVTLEKGEFISESGSGFIYKVKYEGKTIYPVIAFDNKILTVLGEDMVKAVMNDKKYNMKKDPKVYKKRRRPRR